MVRLFKSFGIIWLLSWLVQSTAGQILLGAAVLWYLDDRYTGFLSALLAPVRRWQKISGLRRTVEFNPTDIRSMVELGETYLRGGNPKTALNYLDRAQILGEDSARASYLAGGARVKLGDYAAGRRQLEEALAKKPDVAFGEPYIYLIEEAIASGQPGRADDFVEQLERFEGVEVLTRAGQLCQKAGRNDQAHRLFEEAVQNYGYVPRKMRRRQRRWLVRAKWGLLTLKS